MINTTLSHQKQLPSLTLVLSCYCWSFSKCDCNNSWPYFMNRPMQHQINVQQKLSLRQALLSSAILNSSSLGDRWPRVRATMTQKIFRALFFFFFFSAWQEDVIQISYHDSHFPADLKASAVLGRATSPSLAKSVWSRRSFTMSLTSPYPGAESLFTNFKA
jgi:hypothetical protein